MKCKFKLFKCIIRWDRIKSGAGLAIQNIFLSSSQASSRHYSQRPEQWIQSIRGLLYIVININIFLQLQCVRLFENACLIVIFRKL